MKILSGCTTQIHLFLFLFVITCKVNAQSFLPFQDHTTLTKRVYHFTKVEFITKEGEFNEEICTYFIPELRETSPPFVAIYYKRENSQWFTESLYRKRVRFSFKEGILKLDRTNFWDWFELEEIRVVILF